MHLDSRPFISHVYLVDDIHVHVFSLYVLGDGTSERMMAMGIWKQSAGSGESAYSTPNNSSIACQESKAVYTKVTNGRRLM